MAEECRSCGAPIHWCEKSPVELNNKGQAKTAPVNYDSIDDPAGNLEVWSEPVIPVRNGDPAYALKFRYLKQNEQPAEGHHRAISHFATCEQASQWRNR